MTTYHVDENNQLYEFVKTLDTQPGVEGVALREISPEEAEAYREEKRQKEEQHRKDQEEQGRKSDEKRKAQQKEIAAWLRSVNAPSAVYEFFDIKL